LNCNSSQLPVLEAILQTKDTPESITYIDSKASQRPESQAHQRQLSLTATFSVLLFPVELFGVRTKKRKKAFFLPSLRVSFPLHKFYLHMTDSIFASIFLSACSRRDKTLLTFLWTPGAFNLLYDTLSLFMFAFGHEKYKMGTADSVQCMTRRDHLF
jgi:hypothetical protein